MTTMSLLCCSPKEYPGVTVRPATCSDDVQFAQAESLGHLLQFADKMHKPVFINFYSPWIEQCQRMDQYVFTQNDLAAYFNTHFINFRINIGGYPYEQHLTDMYGVTSFPTMIFLDGKGKVMMRHEGPASAIQLMEMGRYLHEAVETEMVSVGSH
jgi:thioredoxin-related protein